MTTQTKPRFNFTTDDGEHTSKVGNWTVTYPARCNGNLGDLGFAAPLGYGNSGFVHFGATTGQAYGMSLPVKVLDRLRAMRRAFGECDGCDQDPFTTAVHYGGCPLA